MEFDDIWSFVEEKLKTPIPTYFKNVLKVCGYDNGISISTIVEDDIHYFESEVRNGSVLNYFKDKNGNTYKKEEILEGSSKSETNFEFIRGHRKFLMSIAKFLKNCLEENGPDSFILEVAPKKNLAKTTTKKREQKIAFPNRKRKTSPVDSLVESTITKLPRALPDELEMQRKVLLSKVIRGLETCTSELYAKNTELIKKKVSSLLLVEPIDKSKNPSEKSGEACDEEKTVDQSSKLPPKFIAHVFCRFCLKNIRAFHIPTEKNEALWNTYNFNRHLQKLHPQTDNSEIPDIEKKEKEEETCEKPCVLPLEPAAFLSENPTVDMTWEVIVIPAETDDTAVVISDGKSDDSTVEKLSFANDCSTTSTKLYKECSIDANSATISELRNICPQYIVCYTDSDSNEESQEEEVKQIESKIVAQSSGTKHNKHDINKTASRSREITIPKSISGLEHFGKEINETDKKAYIEPRPQQADLSKKHNNRKIYQKSLSSEVSMDVKQLPKDWIKYW